MAGLLSFIEGREKKREIESKYRKTENWNHNFKKEANRRRA